MGNLTMDIKEKLRQESELPGIPADGPVYYKQLCREALAEIERLEKVTGVGVSLEMYETLRRERDAARRQRDELAVRCRQLETKAPIEDRAQTKAPPNQAVHHVEFHPNALATMTRAVVAFERIAAALEKALT